MQNIENLVFSGGSVKAFAFIGAIQELENRGLMSKIKRFAGTSAGALFASFLAAGFTSQDIIKIRPLIDFSELSKNGIMYSIYSIYRHHGYGIHSTHHIQNEIEQILSTKGIKPDITLKELFNLTGKELVIVTANINKEKACYLHHATHPNVGLVQAILCSMSVPVLFRTKEHDFDQTMDLYVDGGLCDNYPLWVFNNIEALYSGKLPEVERDKIPTITLGLKLFSPNQDNTYDLVTGRKNITGFESFLMQLLNTMMTQIDKSFVSPSFIKQTIPIHIPNISFLQFDITPKQQDELIAIGQKSVVEYCTQVS